MTFANGLRSILRQDPDAILVGEIRDVETARIAVQAALTGHFVISSLHATDSVSALHRLHGHGHRAVPRSRRRCSAWSASGWSARSARTASSPYTPTRRRARVLRVGGGGSATRRNSFRGVGLQLLRQHRLLRAHRHLRGVADHRRDQRARRRRRPRSKTFAASRSMQGMRDLAAASRCASSRTT